MRTANRMKKVIAAILTGMMVVTMVPMNVLAGAPKVMVDEAVYVNMDYYGGVEDVEIVKGCVLNGNTKIVDHGNYTEIVNMTNSIEPVVKGDEITWDISGSDVETFYFEAKAKELDMELPWTIDVSYKINGKPARGEDLAGASGLISTIIEATPNDKAPEYYKNNMVLAIGTVADMDSDTYSLSAPGAQMQSFGTMKAVFFLGLPGESGTYQIDMGTNSYESMGCFIAMVPATLDSLGMINDVREVRDKVKDSLNLMSDSADVIFDNLENMRSGLEKTRKGLEQAKSAKGLFDNNKDQVKADADAAIDSLDGISNSLMFLANQSAIEKQDFNKAMDRIEGMRSTLYGMQAYTDDTREELDDLNDELSDLKRLMKEDAEVGEEQLEELETLLKLTENDLKKIAGGAAKDKSNLDKLNASLSAAADPEVAATIGKVINYGLDTGAISASELASGAPSWIAGHQDKFKSIAEKMVTEGLLDAVPDASLLVGSNTASMATGLLKEGTGSVKEIQGMISELDDMLALTHDLLVQGDALGWEANTEYRKNLNTLIDQLEEFMLNANTSIAATQTALKSLRNIMDITEDAVSVAIDSSLDGMIDIIGSTIGITSGTETFRDAKNTMKDAIDDEIDNIEEDSNVLNLDITQDFPSFTSPKNDAPASIQIIMRTKEVSIDKDEVDNSIDIELEKEDLGFWGRLKAVFVKIANLFTGKEEEPKPSAIETQKSIIEAAKNGSK